MGHLWDFSSALQCPVPASAGRRPELQCISASQCQAFGWHSSAQCLADSRPGPAVASATLHCVHPGFPDTIYFTLVFIASLVVRVRVGID